MLTHYHDRWRYLHVDEYQDTNRAQYLWIRHLAGKRKNVAVVGDDDQSIYSWRGADLRNILDFERDYPDATVVKLEQNYRSTQLILDAAHAVVSRNEARKDKKLWTENPRGVPDRALRGRLGGRGGRVGRAPGRGARRRSWRGRLVPRPARRRGRRAAPPPARHRGHVSNERPEPRDRGGVPALRPALPARRRHALLPAARGQGRARLPARAAQRLRRAPRTSAIINVPTRGIGEKTIAAVRDEAARRERQRLAGARCAGRVDAELATRTRSAIASFVELIESLRRRVGVLALPELLDAMLEETRLSGDAARRLAGGRGSLGEPARAARGGHAATATWSPRTRSTGCSRRRPSSPTRTPTRRTPTRSR